MRLLDAGQVSVKSKLHHYLKHSSLVTILYGALTLRRWLGLSSFLARAMIDSYTYSCVGHSERTLYPVHPYKSILLARHPFFFLHHTRESRDVLCKVTGTRLHIHSPFTCALLAVNCKVHGHKYIMERGRIPHHLVPTERSRPQIVQARIVFSTVLLTDRRLVRLW